ncbi:MAG: 3-dehydroquinate synthase [Maricaulis sp.]|nr:3-dehydroquinate synthase [Maricaulis sp.]
MSHIQTISVGLGDRSYDVLIGDGALTESVKRLPALIPRGKTIIITDETVAPLHLATITKILADADIAARAIVLPSGEATKSFGQLETLVNAFLESGMERSDAVIALGGGVIGDLVGFAAAVTKRGINFIQIPTTLLSQVDSSVGGKTGINTRHGKNFVGSFHQPCLVIADTMMLETLPDRERRSGYAEIIKAALIGDYDLFDRLEAAGAHALSGDTLRDAVADAVSFKAQIVADDEREQGVRALLNLGHTFGHAFEATAPKDIIRHGEAVAAGISMAFRYSVHLGVCPSKDADRVEAHLRTIGLPDGPKALAYSNWNTADLVAKMRDDKKNSGGRITLVLARGIAKAYIESDTSEDDLAKFMETRL